MNNEQDREDRRQFEALEKLEGREVSTHHGLTNFLRATYGDRRFQKHQKPKRKEDTFKHDTIRDVGDFIRLNPFDRLICELIGGGFHIEEIANMAGLKHWQIRERLKVIWKILNQ